MNDRSRPEPVGAADRDEDDPLTGVERRTDAGVTITTYTFKAGAPPTIRFEPDPTAGVFRLTAADGSVELFRDRPARYLRVEPDPESGAMRPVMKSGRPVYLYLCREEREAR